jgi:iron-only hydrogenase maturation rSAM protein HydE
MRAIVDKLRKERTLTHEEFEALITNKDPAADEYLYSSAREVTDEVYGRGVFIRGLIEVTSYCKNDCYYCGIRRSNARAQRYRLTKEQILECCSHGYNLGFRTFVLQGGEDGYFTDKILADIVSSIKSSHPDCAVTLSFGEKSYDSYKMLKDAGADRYLLRHETADECHYGKLHPETMTLKSRMQCLRDLKEIGYQVGCGFMVGSPYQTTDNVISDLEFIRDFKPHMVGIGPYLPHNDTPFRDRESGSLRLTLTAVAITRLLLPNALIPSTTALATLHPNGRKLGIAAGANVIMPNLSPSETRKKYALYENKETTTTMEELGEYEIIIGRGDAAGENWLFCHCGLDPQSQYRLQ